MATTIITKNGSGAPAAGDLVQGELAVDLTNKTLYSKDSSGNVFKVGDTGGGSPGTFTDLVATDSFTSPGIDDNATSTAITIDANENVGVGTDSPDHRLHVLGSYDTAGFYRDVDVNFSGPAGNYAQFGAKKAGVEIGAASFGSQLEVDGLRGAAIIQTLTNGTLTRKVTVDSQGNVGIGTDAPTDKLHVSVGGSGGTSHVYTDLLVESNTNTAIQLLATSNNEQALWFGDNDNPVAGGISYYHVTDNLSFRTGDSPRMVIDASGNVGIGTSVPSATLNIKGSGGFILNNAAGSCATSITNDADASLANIEHYFGAGSSIAFRTNASGAGATERMRLTSVGNVGIGESNPAEKLVVNGKLGFAYSNGSAPYTIGKATNQYGLVYKSNVTSTPSEIAHTFSSGVNSNIMSMTYGGNVGIGTDTPATSLDIVRAGVEPLRIESTTSDSVQVRFASTTGNAFIKSVGNDIVIPSGNLGIGRSPNTKLDIEVVDNTAFSPSSSGNILTLRNTSTTAGSFAGIALSSSGTGGNAAQAHINVTGTTSGNGNLVFSTRSNSVVQERMRIDNSGNLLVGTTQVRLTEFGQTDSGINLLGQSGQEGQIQAQTSGIASLVLSRRSSDGAIVDFRKNGTSVGQINTKGSNIAIGADDTGLQFETSIRTIRPFHMTANTAADGAIDLGHSSVRFKGAYFSGTVTANTFDGTVVRSSQVIQDGAPVVDSLQIIRAFMKLRAATADPDSTVEELREKLKTAVDDIIDQFQDQIDNMPTPLED